MASFLESRQQFPAYIIVNLHYNIKDYEEYF